MAKRKEMDSADAIAAAIKAERAKIIAMIEAYKTTQFHKVQKHQVFTCDDIITLLTPATRKGRT